MSISIVMNRERIVRGTTKRVDGAKASTDDATKANVARALAVSFMMMFTTRALLLCFCKTSGRLCRTFVLEVR